MPCPAAGSADIPLVQGSRRRFRLLRVHSHSHAVAGLVVGKRRARERHCALIAQGGLFAVLCCVCLRHCGDFSSFGAVSLRLGAFLPSYQNSFPFSSEIVRKTRRSARAFFAQAFFTSFFTKVSFTSFFYSAWIFLCVHLIMKPAYLLVSPRFFYLARIRVCNCVAILPPPER